MTATILTAHTLGSFLEGNDKMIVNINSRTTLQSEWAGVIRMRERMDHLVIKTFAFDPITSPVFGDILYNLPFQLACEVLRQVLLQAKVEGPLPSCEYQLGDLMDSSKTILPWVDWQGLRDGVERQKQLAHQGTLFGDKQCLQDIENIEAQLVAWGLIPAA